MNGNKPNTKISDSPAGWSYPVKPPPHSDKPLIALRVKE